MGSPAPDCTIWLALLNRASWRDMRERGARERVVAVPMIGAAVGVLAPLLAFLGFVPIGVGLAGLTLASATFLASSLLLRLPGALSNDGGLLRDWQILQRHMRQVSTSRGDRTRLVTEAQRLDRWRDSTTSEFIDLVQDEVRDIAAGASLETARAVARDERMEEISRSIWATRRRPR